MVLADTGALESVVEDDNLRVPVGDVQEVGLCDPLVARVRQQRSASPRHGGVLISRLSGGRS